MNESNAIKVGDRVRVEYEGVVETLGNPVGVRDGRNRFFYAHGSALTVITPPLPPEPWILALIRAVSGYAKWPNRVSAITLAEALDAIPEVWREAARESKK